MIARPILPSSHEIPAFIFCNHAIRNTLFPEWEDGRIHTLIPPCAHARSCAGRSSLGRVLMTPVRTCAIMCVFVCCVYILPYSHREKER